MTKHLSFLTAVALAVASPLSAAPKPKINNFSVDTKLSSVKWNAKKVTGQHHGTVDLKSGKVTLTNDNLTAGEFVVDMASIKVVDLEDKDLNAKLTGHLKSDDFFGVEKFPAAKLVITKVETLPQGGEFSHKITGDLTIKGHTHPVTFPAKIMVTGKQATADGTMTIDRTLYDVRYGSGKFFQNLGDKTIYDDFTLDLHIIAQ